MALVECLRNQYHRDPFFRDLLRSSPGTFRDFVVEDGLICRLIDDCRRLLCIPNILIGKRAARQIVISHAHSILAHLGHRKTLAYLQNELWWKYMVADVKSYCSSCSVCATSKIETSQPFGLLRPLPIPTRPWQSIGIDFVGLLPESSNRYESFDMIYAVIDHLTSMVHLIPTKQTYRACDIAEVVFDHVYELHGLPERIISDRDTLFTSYCILSYVSRQRTILKLMELRNERTVPRLRC